MKMLIITQFFPPEMGAPQARLYEMAKRLQGMGHEITVLTAMPNYPLGRVFNGYRWRIRTSEDMNDIRVVRTCLYPSKSSRLLPRLICFFSFAATCLLLGHWGIGRQDLVIVESPPLFLVPPAFIISRLKRAKTILMAADLWPDMLIQIGRVHKGPAVNAIYWLESFCYHHSSAVALTTPGMRDEIRRRFPHLPNITLLSNGVDTSVFGPEHRSSEVRREFGATDDDFLVGYCGLHGLIQDMDIILEAARRLRDRPGIKFVMIGDGPVKEDLERKAASMSLSNLRMFGHRPKSEMPPVVASLDASLMPLPAPITGAMPSKVYEALASGAVPIVTKGTDADALVTKHQAGLSYEPGDIEEFVSCITRLAEDRAKWRVMRQNALELSKRFDREILVKRAIEMFTAVAAGQPLPEVEW